MQLWHMEPFACGDRRLPHHCFPPKHLALDQLSSLTGAQHFKIDLDDTVAMKKRLSRVKGERNINASDTMTINEHVTDLAQKLEELYEPVQKPEDTVNLVLDGQCYFDIEVDEDEWIRVHLEKGDLLVIPKFKTHRFTVTPHNYVQLQRFFQKKNETMQG